MTTEELIALSQNGNYGLAAKKWKEQLEAIRKAPCVGDLVFFPGDPYPQRVIRSAPDTAGKAAEAHCAPLWEARLYDRLPAFLRPAFLTLVDLNDMAWSQHDRRRLMQWVRHYLRKLRGWNH